MYHEWEKGGANEMIYVNRNNIGERQQKLKETHNTKHFIPFNLFSLPSQKWATRHFCSYFSPQKWRIHKKAFTEIFSILVRLISRKDQLIGEMSSEVFLFLFEIVFGCRRKVFFSLFHKIKHLSERAFLSICYLFELEGRWKRVWIRKYVRHKWEEKKATQKTPRPMYTHTHTLSGWEATLNQMSYEERQVPKKKARKSFFG